MWSDIHSDIQILHSMWHKFWQEKTGMCSGDLFDITSDILKCIISGMWSDIQSDIHCGTLSGICSGKLLDKPADMLYGIMSDMFSNDLLT